MANEKITGKNSEFWWEGKEVPQTSIKAPENYETIDSTDSATPGDGKDFEIGRVDRTIDVEQILYTADGAEIATGTLLAGHRYRVTAKDTVLSEYEVGQLFDADGTEVMSATDKVVPLGTKLTGKNIDLTLGVSTVAVTDFDFTTSYDEVDVTDSETAGDAKETIVSRADRESKISLVMRSETADLLTSTPDYQNAALTFASGQTIVGQAILTNKEPVVGNSEGVKVSYTLKWKGKPIETLLGLTPAVEKAFRIVYVRGATTNKETSGNAIITKKTITANVVSDMIKLTYSMKVNGAVTHSVAD